MTARFLTRLITRKCAFVEGSKLARGKKCKVTRAGWGRIRSGAVGKNADDIGEGVDARIMCVCVHISHAKDGWGTRNLVYLICFPCVY